MTPSTITDTLAALPGRIRVVATNLLTYLIGGQAVLTWLLASGNLEGFPVVGEYGTAGLAVLAAAITFIRRVTPVAPAERGLLPVV